MATLETLFARSSLTYPPFFSDKVIDWKCYDIEESNDKNKKAKKRDDNKDLNK